MHLWSYTRWCLVGTCSTPKTYCPAVRLEHDFAWFKNSSCTLLASYQWPITTWHPTLEVSRNDTIAIYLWWYFHIGSGPSGAKVVKHQFRPQKQAEKQKSSEALGLAKSRLSLPSISQILFLVSPRRPLTATCNSSCCQSVMTILR